MGSHSSETEKTENMILSIILLVGVAASYAEECGKPDVKHNTRVVAGQTATRGSWPWQILMKFGGRASCGGTLIAPQWVVTAAHCVYRREHYPYLFSVVLGEHDRSVEEGSEEEIRVERVFRNPSYNPRVLDNDIAMFKLTKPAKLGKYVKTACLPTGDVPVGTDCYITGWEKHTTPDQWSEPSNKVSCQWYRMTYAKNTTAKSSRSQSLRLWSAEEVVDLFEHLVATATAVVHSFAK